LELNNDPPNWTRFVQLVQIRFGPPLTDSPINELALLRREGSVDDYCKQFRSLSYRDPAIFESHQIQLFTAGLGKPLRTNVSLQKPETLNEAIMYARAYEQRDHKPQVLAASATAPRPGARSFPRQSATPAAPAPVNNVVSSIGSVNNKPTTSLKLSPAAIAERKKTGQCFHCNDLYVPGHKEVCKYLFTIQVLGDDESDLADEAGDPTISLHALTGIQPSSGKTMQLHILVNGVVLTTLLDSGSTHNFVDTDAATRAGIQLRGASGLRVAVANGDRVHSPGCYKALRLTVAGTVAGEPFDIDIYGLALGSFNGMLGVQWLESLGPVLWYFTKRTIAFVRGG
jgi:hypothetical protein